MRVDIPCELRDEDVAAGLVEVYFADDPATGRARYSGAYRPAWELWQVIRDIARGLGPISSARRGRQAPLRASVRF